LDDSHPIVLAVSSYVASTTQEIRVFVIDDHAGMREGISAVVNAQRDMKVVGEASDGQEAIQRFRALQPDVALLDWNLPAVRGEDVLATLGAEFPQARFIVITALSDGDCIRRALSLGAQGYLHKDMLRRQLVAAIRAVHQGQEYLPDDVLNRPKKDS